MNRIFLILIMFIFSGSLSAADGWYGDISIGGIVVEVGGNGYSLFTNSPIADCGVPGKFHINQEFSWGKDMYSMALTAFTVGKTVKVFVDASEGCKADGMVITAMWVH